MSATERMQEAVKLLVEAGFDKNEFMLAVHTKSPKKGVAFEYDWFIDAGTEDLAHVKSMIGKHMKEELDFQSRAYYDDERCPECGDQRYGIDQAANGPGRVRFFMRCFNCGHEGKMAER